MESGNKGKSKFNFFRKNKYLLSLLLFLSLLFSLLIFDKDNIRLKTAFISIVANLPEGKLKQKATRFIYQNLEGRFVYPLLYITAKDKSYSKSYQFAQFHLFNISVGQLSDYLWEELVCYTKDPDPEIRYMALFTLTFSGNSKSQEVAWDMINNDQDENLRYQVIRNILNKSEDREVYNFMLNALESDNKKLRDAVYYNIIGNENERFIDYYREKLKSRDPAFRSMAIETLQKIGWKKVVYVIRPYVEDEDPSVRKKAIKALEKIKRRYPEVE